MRLSALRWDIRSDEEYREQRRNFVIPVLPLIRDEEMEVAKEEEEGRNDATISMKIIPKPIPQIHRPIFDVTPCHHSSFPIPSPTT